MGPARRAEQLDPVPGGSAMRSCHWTAQNAAASRAVVGPTVLVG
ncbi:hypothetical protein ACWGQL_34770 [Streptomyces lydicus]